MNDAVFSVTRCSASKVACKGTAILYSAGAGQVAQDGSKRGHGVFTGALLDVLDRPGFTATADID